MSISYELRRLYRSSVVVVSTNGLTTNRLAHGAFSLSKMPTTHYYIEMEWVREKRKRPQVRIVETHDVDIRAVV